VVKASLKSDRLHKNYNCNVQKTDFQTLSFLLWQFHCITESQHVVRVFVQTFEELVELAANGNSRKLDIYSNELFENSVKVEGEEDMYTFTQGMAPTLMYCFGKAATGKGRNVNSAYRVYRRLIRLRRGQSMALALSP
jgi:hypothetical protein